MKLNKAKVLKSKDKESFQKKLLNLIFTKTVLKRRLFFYFSDTFLISFSIYVSFWLRFNGVIPDVYKTTLPYYILLALLIKLTFLSIFNVYDISWRFVSLNELVKIFKSLSFASLGIGMALYLLRTFGQFRVSPFPRSILLVDFMISLILIGSFRISKRVLIEGFKNTLRMKKEKTKILIIGAGNAGEQIVREMVRDKISNYYPIGFVDDDLAKRNIKIHGVKVLGKREDIPQIISNYEVDEVLIALPSVDSKEVREIVQIVRDTNAIEKINILPNTLDLMNGKITLSDIQEIELQDLLGRVPVKIDFETLKDFIQDKKILITGAGGSIGSELVKSVIKFYPKKLIVFDIDETDLFNLTNEIKYSQKHVVPVVGDIKDEVKIASVIEEFLPHIVIHSAAYKHVPILESFPEEAIKTNILGTKILAELSIKFSVDKFIFISTDKAINPTSVMGATKRAGEDMLKIYNSQNKTKFISVRFGNVLGSRGSVIPVFKEQIKKRQAVTVTHPEMKRYFMITSEAVLLVLEASAMGEGGEIFVLDMGEPIKILDLAKEMIRLSGFEPDGDIPIVFTNIRPGEKLYEEILSAEEGVESTEYEKIMKAKRSVEPNAKIFMDKVDFLIETSSQKNNKDEIIKLLQEIVPHYKPFRHIL